MSLITCCPSCATKFRVVADQLRISDGWVRCGRCQEVFDASQSLEAMPSVVPEAPQAAAVLPPPAGSEAGLQAAETVETTVHALAEAPSIDDLSEPEPEPEPSVLGYELPAPPEDPEASWLDAPVDQDMSAPWGQSTSIAQRMHNVVESREPTWEEDDMPAAAQEGVSVEAVPSGWASGWADAPQPAPEGDGQAWAFEESAGPALEHEPALEAAHIELDLDIPEVPAAVAVAAEPDNTAWADSVAAMAAPLLSDREEEAVAAHEAAAEPVPDFVKQAQRKAWWSQPAVRFVMGMLVVFLPITLALQIAVHERNTLVAWKPQWRPAVAALCGVLGCELAPRKHIASVAVTGSSFAHEARPNRYRLDVSLQNQSALAVATPAVELTLTDTQDQVLVRKVLNLAEIGAPAELAGHSEWNGTLPVMTQGLNLPVSGYRVMAFYP